MEQNDVHFETLDFEGRKIICKESWWHFHIVGDIHHTNMAGHEKDIVEALQNPEYGIRYIDRKHPNHRIYYKSEPKRRFWLKVVVKYTNDECSGIGEVWTAFLTDSKPARENPEL